MFNLNNPSNRFQLFVYMKLVVVLNLVLQLTWYYTSCNIRFLLANYLQDSFKIVFNIFLATVFQLILFLKWSHVAIIDDTQPWLFLTFVICCYLYRHRSPAYSTPIWNSSATFLIASSNLASFKYRWRETGSWACKMCLWSMLQSSFRRDT